MKVTTLRMLPSQLDGGCGRLSIFLNTSGDDWQPDYYVIKESKSSFQKEIRTGSSYDFRGQNPISACVSAACISTVLICPQA